MELVRFVLPRLAAGCLAGLVAAAGLVATNVGSLRDLMQHTQGGWLACGLMMAGFAAIFGSAAAGGAVMQIGTDRED